MQSLIFLKQLFFIIVLSINGFYYNALIHGSPSRCVVSWNHISFNSWLPWWGFEHVFINFFFTFKKYHDFWYWSIHHVFPVCLVDTVNFQSNTSHKCFLITMCFMALHICQLFLMVFASCRTTMSPTFKFVLVSVYFFLSWGDWKNSFLQRHQYSFTRLRLLRLYKSGLEKSARDGKIIFDFMVR